MKTKDTIATWLLVLFLLVTFGKTLNDLAQALKLSRPVITILWRLGIVLVVAASGLFLILRLVHLTNELEYYEAQEKRRENEFRANSVE